MYIWTWLRTCQGFPRPLNHEAIVKAITHLVQAQEEWQSFAQSLYFLGVFNNLLVQANTNTFRFLLPDVYSMRLFISVEDTQGRY